MMIEIDVERERENLYKKRMNRNIKRTGHLKQKIHKTKKKNE